MTNGSSGGLGKFIYMEWLIPIRDYYYAIRKNEVIFEIAMPATVSLFCSAVYFQKGKVFDALSKLADLLPTAISILIGFTVMLITLLLTSSGESVDLLKKKETEKKLYGKPITLYQGLHIQFSHSLFSEIFLLLLIFLYLFWNGIGLPVVISVGMLAIEVYLTLNILLSILRGIASLYFSFYNNNN